MEKLFANSGDPDQTLHSAASDLGLHCLPITILLGPDYNGLNYIHRDFKYEKDVKIAVFPIENDKHHLKNKIQSLFYQKSIEITIRKFYLDTKSIKVIQYQSC